MEAEQKPGERKHPSSSKTMIFLIVPVTLAITTSIFYGGYYHCPSIPYPAPSGGLEAKLVYTARCTFPPLMTLVLAVSGVGMGRLMTGSKGALNPLAGRDNLIQMHKNVLTNTVEQLLAWLLSTCVLVTYLEGEEMRLVPLYSLAFVVGRILFRIGYSIHPNYRGYGMHINFHSGALVLGLIIYFMITRGLMFGIETGGLAGEGGTGGGERAEL